MGVDKGILKAMNDHKEKISGPHFLFSAQNPKYPEKNKLNLNHDQVLHHLRGAGYDAHAVQGHYGSPEKSIVVYGVHPKHAEQLHQMASKLGQDSSIYSTGQHHEMRFHHGADAGKSHYGEGTNWHSQKPQDFFTSLPGELHHFTHNFDFEQKHPSGQLPIKKSEEICMPQKEFIEEHVRLVDTLKHPTKEKLKEEAKEQSKELKDVKKSEDQGRLGLYHLSSEANLTHIDPKFKGKGVDARTKGRESEHPHSFFYVEGSQPEDVVTSGSSHKYKTSIDTSKQPIYDIGKDPKDFHGQVLKENQGAFNMDMMHAKMKQAGYHGFHNSAHPSLSHVVVMYHPLKVESHEVLK